MKKILMLLPIMASLMFGASDYSKRLTRELNNLKSSQKTVLMHNLRTTMKQTGDRELALIMASIAWKESCFGANRNESKYCNNCSYGTHQVLLLNAMKKLKLKNTDANRKAVRHRLLTDEDLSYRLAMMELKGWLKVHKGNMPKAIASYNAGYKSTSSNAGNKYQKDVFYRKQFLEKYVRDNKISL